MNALGSYIDAALHGRADTFSYVPRQAGLEPKALYIGNGQNAFEVAVLHAASQPSGVIKPHSEGHPKWNPCRRMTNHPQLPILDWSLSRRGWFLFGELLREMPANIFELAPTAGMTNRGLTGARDEFHLGAIVQNLKTLANCLCRPPPDQQAADCLVAVTLRVPSQPHLVPFSRQTLELLGKVREADRAPRKRDAAN
jgi:hypothetical protein